MNWVLLLIVLYYTYKTYVSWFTLSEKETVIYGSGSVKSKEELDAGCSLENWDEYNKNRLIRDEHGNYNKKK